MKRLSIISIFITLFAMQSLAWEKVSTQLELGLGANIGYYHETYYLDKAYVPQGMSQYNYTLKRSTFGYFMYGNIGYRLQTNRGFQFRIGLTPSFNFGDKYGLHREWYYPYVSFGWRLK